MPGKRAFLYPLKMKAIITLIGMFVIMGRPVEERRLVAWVIEPSSSLTINGASNVTRFTCGLESYGFTDTLRLVRRTASQIEFSPNKISVPVAGFDCAHKLITSDFQETLQASEYPQIGISFLSLRLVPSDRTDVSMYEGQVVIELSGKKREFTILFDFWEQSYAQYNLMGHKKLHFTDFELTPPTKMMGLVKVDDELSIDFDLVIRPL